MRSRWSDDEAQAFLDRYAARWGEALALRVYTSRLIGAEASLVMHGGGNTSVKGRAPDVFGEPVDVVFVKGSGWDLATIEPEGLPAVRLHHLRRMCRLPALSDETMVNEQRTHLLDASAPNPSIEALLHAFLPATFVDHSHADAILLLTNRAGGEAHVRAALGEGVLLVPYVKPGFDLAAVCARLLDDNPGCTSMVLMQHGLFTWGETARESYERHIELVSRAEAYVAARPALPAALATDDAVAVARRRAARLLPLLRGALARGGAPCVLEYRVDPGLLGRVDDPRLGRWAAAGPLTPDHVIRTKVRAAVLDVPWDQDEGAWRAAVDACLDAARQDYHATFDAHVAGRAIRRLDPNPRVVLVPGLGLVAAGDTVGAARVCADIGARTLEVKELSEGLGPFEGLDDASLFEVEHWSLEQAKLGKGRKPELAARVALITGGAGAIGVGVARVLLDAGACVVLADRDEAALARARELLGGRAALATVVMDVTDEASVEAGVAAAVCRFGGVDIFVPNAGVARSAAIADLDLAGFEQVMDVNATGAFLTVREAARLLTRQGSGGHIVLISSKNVFGPGEEFAAYSASKAAAHQLGRVAALELARHGVRVNMVNPDAVFAQDGVPSGLWASIGPDRARARGLRPEELPEFYRQRNLLHATVTGEHVGQAVLFFAAGRTPTTGAALPVDGGVAGAFPR